MERKILAFLLIALLFLCGCHKSEPMVADKVEERVSVERVDDNDTIVIEEPSAKDKMEEKASVENDDDNDTIVIEEPVAQPVQHVAVSEKQDIDIAGVHYSFDSDCNGYVASASAESPSIFILPAIEGLPVVGIKDYGFYCNEDISGDLVIPGNIRFIGESAFEGCLGIQRLFIVSTILEEIGEKAFCGDSSIVGDLVIPASVSRIGDCAFKGCSFDGILFVPGSIEGIGGLFEGIPYRQLAIY